MAKPKVKLEKIVRVDRSPMNPKIWIAQLECGHDLYLYRKPRANAGGRWCERCNNWTGNSEKLRAEDPSR